MTILNFFLDVLFQYFWCLLFGEAGMIQQIDTGAKSQAVGHCAPTNLIYHTNTDPNNKFIIPPNH